MISNVVTSAVVLTLIFPGRGARAAELWASQPLWPLSSSPASTGGHDAAAGGAFVAGSYAPGFVPPFRAASRDRLTVGTTARVLLFDRVQLGADWAWLTDRTQDGSTTTGPGDLRLGTLVRVIRVGGIDFGLGWEAKLPNAADEGQLGSDETDISFGASADWRRGPWAVGGALGLGVWGNPLRFANQDDVPLLLGYATWTGGMITAGPVVRAELPTSRNPARAEVGGELRVGGRWFGWAAGSAGLTPAAADGSVALGVGFRHGYGGG